MTPVVHCSVGSVSLFHIGSFRPSREIQIRRFRGSERYSRVTSPSHHGLLQPQPAFRLISIYKTSWSSASRLRTLSAAAVETDVAVEGSSSPSGETSGESSEDAPGAAETTTEQAEAGTRPASSAPKVGRNVRKSEMPPLKEEDLVPGASFTGKVRSIKPFGVFVDIGAFTEGLVHISRVSDGFVEDISTMFTVGQEVSVRLVEANKQTRRISLTMRTGGDYVKEAPNAASGGKSPTSAPRSSPRQTKDFKKIDEEKYARGKSLTGIIKNTNRTGSFVTLPDGDEGFLPREEEAAALFTLIGHSALEVGQEVTVKVLNVSRGQVNLTMKGGDDDEDELASLNTNLKQGWSRGTNAFELAFRKSKEISAFLDEREKITVPEVQAEVETESSVAPPEVDSKIDDKLVSSTEVESKTEDSSSAEAVTGAIEEITPVAVETEASVEEVPATASTESVDKASAEAVTGAIEEITPVAVEPEASVEEVPATASTESVDKETAVETEEVAASSEKTTEVAAAGAVEASTTTGQQ